MGIESVGASGGAAVAQNSSLQPETAVAAQDGSGQDFESLLQSLSHGTEPGGFRLPTVDGARGFAAPELEGASTAGDLQVNVLDQAEADFRRLNELLSRIHHEGPFSLQELMGMQLEVYKITVQLETTTKAIAEAVNDTRQLMQQQL